MRVLTGARLAVLSLPLLGGCDAMFGYRATSTDGTVGGADARADRGQADMVQRADRPALDGSMLREVSADVAVSQDKPVSPDKAVLDAGVGDAAVDKSVVDVAPDKGAVDTMPSPDASVGPLSCAWAYGYGAADDDRVQAVAADGSGNVYLTGYFGQTVKFGGQPLTSAGSTDIFLVSLGPAGNVRWAKSFGAAGVDMGDALAVDASGNVYLAGMFQGSVSFGGGTLTAQIADIVLASFDSAGNHLWSKRYGGPSVDISHALAVDKSNNVFMTGEYVDTVDFGGGALPAAGMKDLFVASFAAGGGYRWAKRYGAADSEIGAALAADSSGNIYVAGVFWGSGLDLGGTPTLASAGQDDMFLASYTNSGAYRWAKGFGSSASEQPAALAADASGNVYMVGFYDKAISFGGSTLPSSNREGFIASFDTGGGHRWSQRIGGNNMDAAQDVAVDAAGNILVGGAFSVTADVFGKTLASIGGMDLFLASLSSSGALSWAIRLGGTNTEGLGGLAVDGAGGVFLGGSFYGSTDLGQGPISGTNMNATDAFVVKLAP